jgi:hypothetical protein
MKDLSRWPMILLAGLALACTTGDKPDYKLKMSPGPWRLLVAVLERAWHEAPVEDQPDMIDWARAFCTATIRSLRIRYRWQEADEDFVRYWHTELDTWPSCDAVRKLVKANRPGLIPDRVRLVIHEDGPASLEAWRPEE